MSNPESPQLTDSEVAAFKQRLSGDGVHFLLERTSAQLALDVVSSDFELDGESAAEVQDREAATDYARRVAESAASFAIALHHVVELPGSEWPLHPNLNPGVIAEATAAAEADLQRRLAEQGLEAGDNNG